MLRVRSHVSRFRDPRDGRARLVDLSADGREVHSTARRAFRTAAGRVSRHLGDREPQVREALALLAEACAEAQRESGG
jgi:DNA-binding MarR family transcriptional regulator